MRIALCQTNPTVGALEANTRHILELARQAAAKRAVLAVFPELSLCGYPPRDLLDRAAFVRDCETWLQTLTSEAPTELTLLVGYPSRAPQHAGTGRLRNAVAVIAGGTLQAVVHKRLLPTYDVFDEDRYFEPGDAVGVHEVAGVRLGLSVCEDLWNVQSSPQHGRYACNPVADCLAQGAEVLINLSASPFTLPKRRQREEMLSSVARISGVPLVVVNQVGGNDDLVFDGASAIYGPDGAVWAQAAAFREDCVVADLNPGGPQRQLPATDPAAALSALTLGVRDYASKCGFETAVLGLSGGIDSAVTACIAARALGASKVLGVALPTRYSSAQSAIDARELAAALGIGHRQVTIDQVFQSFLDLLEPELEGLPPPRGDDTTFENIQARIRCTVLMALSNRAGHLLLTTGNKSEIAVGYCTLYGDMAGGLAVLSDVPKTFVYRLASEINRQAGRDLISASITTKPPSAELKPGQTDQDSLPPYEVLDAILEGYIEDGHSHEQLVRQGFDARTVKRVLRMVHVNEYKRRQMPPGLIVTRKAFGPGRRYPIAQAYR